MKKLIKRTLAKRREEKRNKSDPITPLLLLVYITYDGGAHHLAII